MKNIFKNTETENQLIIRWADSLILESDYKGNISKRSLTHDYYNSENPPTEEEKLEWNKSASKIIRDEFLKNFGASNYGEEIHELARLSELIKSFLLNNDYINEPKYNERFLTITPIGKEVKRHKGHTNYQKYTSKKLKAEIAEMNGKIHWLRRAIIAAIVSGLIGYGLRYLIEPKEKISADQPSKEVKPHTTLAKPIEKSDTAK